MSLSDRLNFENAMLCYKTYGQEDFVKDHVREAIRASLDEKVNEISSDFIVNSMQ